MSARFFANPPGSRPLLDTVRDSIALYFSPIRWLWTRIVRGEEERADDSDLDVSGFLTAVPRVNLQLGSPAFKGWVGHLRDEPLSSRTTEDLEQVFNETTIQLIFRSVLRWTGGDKPELAEDITQEVFLRAWMAPPHIPTSEMEPWLLKVARNLIIDQRHSKKGGRNQDQLETRRTAQESPETLLERTEQIEDFITALASVPGGAELLMHVEGFNYAEIQHHVGAPTPDAIRKRIARALEILREDPRLQRYSPRPRP